MKEFQLYLCTCALEGFLDVVKCHLPHWTSWYGHSQLWLLIRITKTVLKIMIPPRSKLNLCQFRVEIESYLPLKMEETSRLFKKKKIEFFKGTLHQYAINRVTLQCYINWGSPEQSRTCIHPSHEPYLRFMLQMDMIKNKPRGFPSGSGVKNPSANAGDMGSILGPGRPHMSSKLVQVNLCTTTIEPVL